MRLVCPECHNNVTVPDDAAGKEATCPNCGKSFPTPPRYTAAVSEASAGIAAGVAGAAPPGLVPPTVPVPAAAPAAPPGLVPTPAPAPPDGFLPATPPASTAAAPVAGYTKSCGITFAPNVIAWFPAVLLTLVFVFTLFPWVGSYAGDTAVYSQGPWRAAFVPTPARNHPALESVIPSKWIDKSRSSDWELLVPFLFLLFITLVFAWLERAFRAAPPDVPPLKKVWPWRNVLVAGGAALVLLFFLSQLAMGFGMERAIKQQVTEQYAEQRAKAADSPSELGKVEYAEQQSLKGYNLEWTRWLYLALLCNVLAVCAVLIRVALEKRGNKPPPKLLLHY